MTEIRTVLVFSKKDFDNGAKFLRQLKSEGWEELNFESSYRTTPKKERELYAVKYELKRIINSI